MNCSSPPEGAGSRCRGVPIFCGSFCPGCGFLQASALGCSRAAAVPHEDVLQARKTLNTQLTGRARSHAPPGVELQLSPPRFASRRALLVSVRCWRALHVTGRRIVMAGIEEYGEGQSWLAHLFLISTPGALKSVLCSLSQYK